MLVEMLKAKLHRIRVTEACLDYEGSLTLDPDDMEAVGILPYEKVLCADVENGNRFETYAIAGRRGSHVCCLNGAAAQRRARKGLAVVSFMRCQVVKCLTRGVHPRASSGDIRAKAMTMRRSPIPPLCAAAPLRQHTWLPLLPAIA